jgi:hypothetical protein
MLDQDMAGKEAQVYKQFKVHDLRFFSDSDPKSSLKRSQIRVFVLVTLDRM